mgnify:CR=1 FL=1
MFFSVVIVFLWSFIPFIGYWLAKLLKANGKANKYILFTFGLGIGIIESSLFYFDFLTNEQSTIGTFIVFFLFFIVAFVSTNKAKIQSANTQLSKMYLLRAKKLQQMYSSHLIELLEVLKIYSKK